MKGRATVLTLRWHRKPRGGDSGRFPRRWTSPCHWDCYLGRPPRPVRRAVWPVLRWASSPRRVCHAAACTPRRRARPPRCAVSCRQCRRARPPPTHHAPRDGASAGRRARPTAAFPAGPAPRSTTMGRAWLTVCRLELGDRTREFLGTGGRCLLFPILISSGLHSL